MTNPQKAKGDRAELDLARQLADLTGWPVRRRLGAGRSDDTGDLDGLPDTCAEVKNYGDMRAGIAAALADIDKEHANAGTTHAVSFIKRPRARTHRWIAVLTLEQYCTLLREATRP